MKFSQVQEKKVKKISEMNVDSSKAVGNGCIASSSNSNSAKPYLANGGWPEKSYGYPSNDLTFPPGGISSLRLPVVVVLKLILFLLLVSFCASSEFSDFQLLYLNKVASFLKGCLVQVMMLQLIMHIFVLLSNHFFFFCLV